MKLKRLVIYTGIAILFNSPLILTSCSEKEIKEHTESVHDDDIDFIAHRGLSSLYLDNTLSTIEECNDNNCVDGVEIDVRLTKDNKVVLLHDNSLYGKKISDITYDDLRNIELKYGIKKKFTSISKVDLFSSNSLVALKRFTMKDCDDDRVCTLEEVLDVRNKDKELLVELKFDKGKEQILIDLVAEELSSEDNIVIQSFDSKHLLKMKELYPKFKYQLIISKEDDIDLLDLDFDGYAIKSVLSNNSRVIEKLKEGKSISFWTIDDYSTFIDLQNTYQEYEENISYISDIPDVLCYTYKKKGSE